MHKKQLIKASILFLSTLLINSTAMAFSMPPESSDDYTPSNWETSTSAVDDANNALNHDDSRLLGFALRGYNVPGVDSKNMQQYIDQCGIRTFEEFGDVVKSPDQLDRMSRARDYAKSYNKVILDGCLNK